MRYGFSVRASDSTSIARALDLGIVPACRLFLRQEVGRGLDGVLRVMDAGGESRIELAALTVVRAGATVKSWLSVSVNGRASGPRGGSERAGRAICSSGESLGAGAPPAPSCAQKARAGRSSACSHMLCQHCTGNAAREPQTEQIIELGREPQCQGREEHGL